MKWIFSFCLVLMFAGADAQFFTRPVYPQNYFTWPIGATKALAANFGELRPNHFHMGLDCKSDRAENKEIYAAAEGYVAKVKVEPFGFGQAIYINHPNGYTTLYAHLNAFYPELAAYVKKEQYRLQKWNVFLDIPANLFPVKKGQYIAKSGNTGGSQGPHLHWELRETKTDKVLNPLLFGMPIPDQTPPDVMRIAVYDRTKSTYDQSPKIYGVSKAGSTYTVAGGAINFPSDKVSFAFTAWDRYTGSTNQNGVFEAVVYDNDKAVSGFQLNAIDYVETRLLNGSVDYKLRYGKGPWLQHLSELPGLNADYYKSEGNGGIIDLSDGQAHKITIIIKDANYNSSTVSFTINGTPATGAAPAGELFSPNMVNVFERPGISFYLAQNALYDSVHFQYKESLSPLGRKVYGLHYPGVPVHNYFTVRIKPDVPFAHSDRMVIHRFFGGESDYKKATWESGAYKADFRSFGNFELMEDTTPPVITPVGFSNGMRLTGRIIFRVTDNCQDIGSFNAYLDGKWLMFTNDKAKSFIYTPDENCPPGEHELKVQATDLAGNTTEKIYKFTR